MARSRSRRRQRPGVRLLLQDQQVGRWIAALVRQIPLQGALQDLRLRDAMRLGHDLQTLGHRLGKIEGVALTHGSNSRRSVLPRCSGYSQRSQVQARFRSIRPGSSCRSNLARNLQEARAREGSRCRQVLRASCCGRGDELLDHARAQSIVRDLFEQPRRNALQDGARSGPPRGSARPLRRRRSPLWGGTSERRRLRGEAGRGAISRRSARSPSAVA